MNDQYKVEQVACNIGFFYFYKQTGTYEEQCIKTEEILNSLKLTAVDFANDIATITLQRPGLIIGRKGVEIDALTAYLRKSCNFEIKQVVIKESKGIPMLDCYAYADIGCWDIEEDDYNKDGWTDTHLALERGDKS